MATFAQTRVALADPFAFESVAVNHIKQCLDLCHVQGVSTYWDVLRFAQQIGQNRAVFLHFVGFDAVPSMGCALYPAVWNFTLVTQNLCDLSHGALARAASGPFMVDFLKAVGGLQSRMAPAHLLQPVNTPDFPVAEIQGLSFINLTFAVR